jgi:hypothetical protein
MVMSEYRLRGFSWNSKTYIRFVAVNDKAALQSIKDYTAHYGAVDRKLGKDTWFYVGYVDRVGRSR